MIYCRQKKH